MRINITGTTKGNFQVGVASVDLSFANHPWSQLSLEMQQGLIAMAKDVQTHAILRAPVDTGALRNSIRVSTPTEEGLEVVAGGGFFAGDDGHTKYIGYAFTRELYNNLHPATRHYMQEGLNDTLRTNYIQRFFKRKGN